MSKLPLPAILFCVVALSLLGCAVSPPLQAAEGIRVSGNGAVETIPDMGTLQLHARREGNDPAALEQELGEVVSALLELSRKLGIEETDVTATAVRITPRYRRRGEDNVVEGVVASRSVTIILRDLSQFSDLLQQALAIGINNVDPMSLDSSIRRELEAAALELAMADAIRKADQVAAGFAVKRGSVIDVDVSGHHAAPMMAMQEMRADSSTPLAPGVIRINSQVRATFAIIAAIIAP